MKNLFILLLQTGLWIVCEAEGDARKVSIILVCLSYQNPALLLLRLLLHQRLYRDHSDSQVGLFVALVTPDCYCSFCLCVSE
jgi:hypothetical protein